MDADHPESDARPEAEAASVPPPASPLLAEPAAESLAPADTVTALRQDLETAAEPAPLSEVVPLLVKAVGMLPSDERDQVYIWLLERGIGGSFSSSFGSARRMRSHVLSMQRSGVLPSAQPTGQQVVPIRFPADQHAALRAWCADHGFSMATVIRGLVARFLESQLRAQGD